MSGGNHLKADWTVAISMTLDYWELDSYNQFLIVSTEILTDRVSNLSQRFCEMFLMLTGVVCGYNDIIDGKKCHLN